MSTRIRTVAAEMTGLLLIACLAAFGWWLAGPEAVVPQPPGPVSPAKPAGLAPVGIDSIQNLHQTGLTFFDIRPRPDFEAGRVPGALMWTGEVPSGLKAAVIYGEAEDFNRALEIGQRLVDSGTGEVHVFLDGYSGWLAAGLPVEEGGP